MTDHPEIQRANALAQAGDTGEALAVIERLAGSGNPEGMFTLADMYWRGLLVTTDMPRARRMFAAAADAGSGMAGRALTNLMASGIAGPRDWQGALARLRGEARDDARRAHMLRLIEAMQLTPNGDPAVLPAGRWLSERPMVAMFDRAFTQAECDYLRLVAEPNFMPSMVVTDGKTMLDPIRSSHGSTMHWLIEDPAVHAIVRRIGAMTGTHPGQGEPLYVLRYAPGQQYRRHVDWLGSTNRRVLTALTYLNRDYTGGETEFSKIGLKVRGQPGDMLVFRNATDDGRMEPLSEHAGLPVTAGVKYLATRWIREDCDPMVQG